MYKDPSEFIEDLYQEEAMDDYREAQTRAVTFNFTAADACMFAAIAKRFGRSTAAFGGDLFSPHVNRMFNALGEDDRVRLAGEADQELGRYLRQHGITSRDGDGNEVEPKHWTWLAEAIASREKAAEEGGE
jgi:hypothetical protein